MIVKEMITELRNGNLELVLNNKKDISAMVEYIISKIKSNEIIQCLDDILDILTIGNMIYNNADLDDSEQPIENGVYDILVEAYGKYRIPPVGGEVIIFKDYKNNNTTSKYRSSIMMKTQVNEDLLFKYEIIDNLQITPYQYYSYYNAYYPIALKPVGDGRLNTKHEYPNLVGTIRKAKFVLTIQAESKGVANDNNVVILERDFFGEHFQKCIIYGGQILKGLISLKYDGLSVEATVKSVLFGDNYKVIIVSARTRGDAIESNARDITHILYGYEFYNADPNIFMNELGVKFEAVMTYMGLNSYNVERNGDYKNPRSAISSIINNHKGYKYLKYITLVPLETSVIKEGTIDRLAEVEFMNKYLSTGEYFRYAYIEGDYVGTLFQINKFTEEAELYRSNLPIMYDGVVFEYIDNDIRRILGRSNAVNLYSMAIKFNPLKKQTIFRGYKYTVGVNGVVTPIIYYDPIEFYGGIHDHSTGSSYQRFIKLNLSIGDILNVEYVNDVMPYATKAIVDINFNNPNQPEQFITKCPFCNNVLTLSKSGKSMIDNNINCKERIRSKMSNMMAKLNLKDFAEESFNKLPFVTMTEMIHATLEDLSVLGESNAAKFLERMNELITNPIYDYKIMGALGFTNISSETWKIILRQYSIHQLLYLYDNNNLNSLNEFNKILLSIKGVGPIKADTIECEFELFYYDILYISQMPNVISTVGSKSSRKIRITGFRDQNIIDTLTSYGFDASYNQVTKDTYALLIPDEQYKSTKTITAQKHYVQIIPVNDFMSNISHYL